MGKQRIGGPVVLIAYYVIGIPISSYLAFGKGLHWGIYGLCVGTLIGTAFHLLLYAGIVWRTDWELETKLVQERNAANIANNNNTKSVKAHTSPRSTISTKSN
eukprot:gene9230-11726_t